MLRTRLFLGLLPFFLLLVGTGGYAVLVSRQLANSIQQDLIDDYGAVLASQRMREAATLMSAASARAQRSDPFSARTSFEQQRSAFTQELMAQSWWGLEPVFSPKPARQRRLRPPAKEPPCPA